MKWPLFSIPMAFLGALNHTTRHGVLIRSGRTLEQLAEVDTIVFDKTGTLTQGQITVVGIYPFSDNRENLDTLELSTLGFSTKVLNETGLSTPSQVYAEAFPEQKAHIVRDLHKAGHTVAFVGDGLNDSIALAYADVSVSFARGAEIARETADVVLIDNHLLDFLEVIAIARETRALIEQNIGLVILPNLIALGIATSRGLNPLIATGIHNGSAIAAGLNSLRPLLQHQINPQRMAS